MYVQRNFEVRSRVILVVEKHYYVFLREGARAHGRVALLIQRATLMRRTLSFLSHLIVPFFLHYFINGTIFEKKLLNIKCAF